MLLLLLLLLVPVWLHPRMVRKKVKLQLWLCPFQGPRTAVTESRTKCKMRKYKRVCVPGQGKKVLSTVDSLLGMAIDWNLPTR